MSRSKKNIVKSTNNEFVENFMQEQKQIKAEKGRKLEILKEMLKQKKDDMYNLPVDQRDTLRPEFGKLVDVLEKLLSDDGVLTPEEEALFSNEEQKTDGGKRRKSRRNRKSKKSKKSRKNRKKSKRRSRR